ncbi:MAG: hypothetical protein DRI95_14135 [Bacteroidetes bacterium]|nr:MAG: hypothetical protein DRI95_14135 [Bacteroidota bacterium]
MQYSKKSAFHTSLTKFNSIVIIFILSNCNLLAQKEYPQNYFRSPIDFKILISGNFGELRPNHFHTGLDILTENRVGKNIYAIADGYISRINVSSGGYGNALYITHPNGYVSVYAHLKSFKKELETYLDSVQRAKQQFEMNLYPLPDKFRVKKGEIIALSGNSGRSYGPHLHFEIRERESEEPINPFLFGINVKDNVSPKIFSVTQYNFTDDIDWDNFSKKKYSSINERTLKTNGKVGFGIELYDYTSGRHNTNGIYNLTLKINDTVYFQSQFDKLSFYTNRYINSYIDYGERIFTRKKIIKCFIEPNNRLTNYLVKDKNGIYDFNDGKKHRVEIIAKDFYGNSKKVSFKVQSDTTYITKNTNRGKHFKQKFYFQKINYYDTRELKITFHRNSLLYDLEFQHYTSIPKYRAFSKIHHIHYQSTPLFNKISLAIRVDSLPVFFCDKVLIAQITNNGSFKSIGGKLIDNYVISKTNILGNFVVLVDTIAPVIKPINIGKNSVLNQKTVRFKIFDNLSGIKSYNGYIDNKWVLFKYDAKYHLIKCDLGKENIKIGKHKLILKVSDYKENVATYESNFILK